MKEKNFSEIYNNICSDVGQSIEKDRKKLLLTEFVTLAVILLCFVYLLIKRKMLITSLPLYMITFFLIFFVYIFLNLNLSKKYAKKFKEKIIKVLVEKSGNSSFRFDADRGISEREYISSELALGWDIYKSEDYIEGILENRTSFRMSQVHTEKRETTTDSHGHTTVHYVTTFLGIFGILTIPTNSKNDIKIVNNSSLKKFNKSRIEMESSEFEKYYDVFTNDGNRQGAMEILTPETIERLTQIRNTFKKAINIRIVNNVIYFRISVGDVFEPPTFKNSLDFDLLYRYFKIIDLPRTIYETLIDNIIIMSGDTELRQDRINAKDE